MVFRNELRRVIELTARFNVARMLERDDFSKRLNQADQYRSLRSCIR
jgi:tyrosyl-tRNA synthetase